MAEEIGVGRGRGTVRSSNDGFLSFEDGMRLPMACFPIQIDRGQSSAANIARFVRFATPFFEAAIFNAGPSRSPAAALRATRDCRRSGAPGARARLRAAFN